MFKLNDLNGHFRNKAYISVHWAGSVSLAPSLAPKREMYLCSSLLEFKYFFDCTIVRRGVRVEVVVEIHNSNIKCF